MKIGLLSLLAVGALLVAPAVRAEPMTVLRANVPFAFVVGHRTLPPGEYLVSRVDASDPYFLRIESRDGRSAALLATRDVIRFQAAASPGLVFAQVGGQRLLDRIEVSGHDEQEVAVTEAALRHPEGPAVTTATHKHARHVSNGRSTG